MRFLITGLPRSRTAWMAALLTAHGFPCLHEPEITIPGLQSLAEIFDRGWVGVSDPSIYARRPSEVDREFAKGKFLLIERDSAEAKAAFGKYLGTEILHWAQLEESVARLRERYRPMVVRFEALDDPEAVDLAVRHLTGVPLNRRTFSLFHGLRIEQHKDKAMAAHAPVD